MNDALWDGCSNQSVWQDDKIGNIKGKKFFRRIIYTFITEFEQVLYRIRCDCIQSK
jgi:hypothetical protein